jgi:hypothetical protein
MAKVPAGGLSKCGRPQFSASQLCGADERGLSRGCAAARARNRVSGQVKGKEVDGLDYRFVRWRSPCMLQQRC